MTQINNVPLLVFHSILPNSTSHLLLPSNTHHLHLKSNGLQIPHSPNHPETIMSLTLCVHPAAVGRGRRRDFRCSKGIFTFCATRWSKRHTAQSDSVLLYTVVKWQRRRLLCSLYVRRIFLILTSPFILLASEPFGSFPHSVFCPSRH